MADDEKELDVTTAMIMGMLMEHLMVMSHIPGIHNAVIIVQMKGGEDARLLHQVYLCPKDAHYKAFIEKLRGVPDVLAGAINDAHAKGLGPWSGPPPGESQH